LFVFIFSSARRLVAHSVCLAQDVDEQQYFVYISKIIFQSTGAFASVSVIRDDCVGDGPFVVSFTGNCVFDQIFRSVAAAGWEIRALDPIGRLVDVKCCGVRACWNS
jgi:hypothetical protein